MSSTTKPSPAKGIPSHFLPRVSKATQTRSQDDNPNISYIETITKTILTKVVPMTGIISYHCFALHVFYPRSLCNYMSVNCGIAVANGLMMHSHVATGVYLFYRPHLSRLSSCRRILFSVYGSVLFNFGSILLWASTQVLLPEDPWIIRSLVSLSSALSLILIGRTYVHSLDRLV